MSRTQRALHALVSCAVGLWILAGCVHLDGNLTVRSEAGADTVSGTMLVAVSDEWAIEQGVDPADLATAIVEELEATPDSGVSGQPYSQDGYTGSTLTFDDVPIERLGQASDGALRIDRDGDAYVVSGDLSVLDGPDGSEPVPWSARLSITLPGTIAEHNGSLDGRTVTWDLDEKSTDVTVMARTDGASFWSQVPVPLVALTALAGIGAVVAWRLSRREHDRHPGSGGIRQRQARARGAANSKIGDMLDQARRAERTGRDD